MIAYDDGDLVEREEKYWQMEFYVRTAEGSYVGPEGKRFNYEHVFPDISEADKAILEFWGELHDDALRNGGIETLLKNPPKVEVHERSNGHLPLVYYARYPKVVFDNTPTIKEHEDSPLH